MGDDVLHWDKLPTIDGKDCILDRLEGPLALTRNPHMPALTPGRLTFVPALVAP